ncbi:MAG TPA: hypothetical protein VJC03_04795, partial [bacterium]|nr:hypothetical protein [bacterium]
VRVVDENGKNQDKMVYGDPATFADHGNLRPEGGASEPANPSDDETLSRNPPGFDSDDNDADFSEIAAPGTPVNSGLVWSVYSGNLAISEIAPAASGGQDWVEFYCLADGSLDNYHFYVGDTEMKDFPAITAAAGDHIVLHLNETGADEITAETTTVVNTWWDIYAGISSGGLPSEGVVSLRLGAVNWEDAVCYGDFNGSISSYTAQRLIEALSESEWNSDSPVITLSSVTNGGTVEKNFVYFDGSTGSLMRWLDFDYDPIDRNRNLDWHLASTPTPGGINDRLPSRLLITEIAPSEDGSLDWIELFCVERGALKGIRIYEDTSDLKVLPDVFAEKGDYIILHMNGNPGSDDINGKGADGIWDFYSDDTGLSGSDNIISIRRDDSVWGRETVLDMVIFANGDGSISSTLAESYNTSVATGNWKGDVEAVIAAFVMNAAEVERFMVSPWTEDAGHSIARNFSMTASSYPDTDSRSDFNVVRLQTMGSANRPGGTGEANVLISEVAPSESSGDWVEFYAVSASSTGGMQFFELGNMVKSFPNVRFSQGDLFVLNFGGDEDDDEITSDTNGNGYRDFYTSDSGLGGTDNVLYLKSSAGRHLDAICFSNRDGSFSANSAPHYDALITTGAWSGILTLYDSDGNMTNASQIENYMAGKWTEQAGQGIARLPGLSVGLQDTNSNDDFQVLASLSKGTAYNTELIQDDTLKVFQSPFSPYGEGRYSSALVSYNVPDNTSRVIYIFDIQGTLVNHLVGQTGGSGKGLAVWDGKNDDGAVVPVGIYIVYIEATDMSTGEVTKGKDLAVVGRMFNR